MFWKKQGLIFAPDGRFEWSKTHAQVPIVDCVDENTWRIYYATRDANNKSYTSYVETEAGNPRHITYIHDNPVLSHGRLGSFDEDGIMPASVITVAGKKYLYYIGWSQRKNVPYQNSIGLGISDDNGKSFNKYSEGPILGVNHVDPFFTGTVDVLSEGDFFRAYYLSCIEWKIVKGRPEPLYVIKYATSTDGINWLRENEIVVTLKDEEEGGLASASVVKYDGKYFMWFAKRKYFDFRSNLSNSYRIGFAESMDGLKWKRDDSRSGIDVSENGWDAEMICYPNIVQHNGKLFMFYNGNQFGKSGFGYAIAKF